MLWFSLEAPQGGASNEYPQHMYSLRNKKNILWIPPLIHPFSWFCHEVAQMLNFYVNLL